MHLGRAASSRRSYDSALIRTGGRSYSKARQIRPGAVPFVPNRFSWRHRSCRMLPTSGYRQPHGETFERRPAADAKLNPGFAAVYAVLIFCAMGCAARNAPIRLAAAALRSNGVKCEAPSTMPVSREKTTVKWLWFGKPERRAGVHVPEGVADRVRRSSRRSCRMSPDSSRRVPILRSAREHQELPHPRHLVH